MKKILVIAGIFGILMLCACAPRQIVKDSFGGREVDLLVRPYQSLGVQSTEFINNGKAASFEAAPSDFLLGEDYPGRIRWNAWVVGEEEYFAQALRVGIYADGKFAYNLVVEANEQIARKSRAVILSSRCDYAFDLDGSVVKIDRERFLSEKAYRREMVMRHGSPLQYRRSDEKFAALITRWNLYETDSGDLYSVHDTSALKRISRINPGYGLGERFILKNQIVLSTNPVATVASIALSVFETIRGSSQGWDYESELPNRFMMGQIIAYVSDLRLNLIGKISEQSIQLTQKADNKSAIAGGRRK